MKIGRRGLLKGIGSSVAAAALPVPAVANVLGAVPIAGQRNAVTLTKTFYMQIMTRYHDTKYFTLFNVFQFYNNQYIDMSRLEVTRISRAYKANKHLSSRHSIMHINEYNDIIDKGKIIPNGTIVFDTEGNILKTFGIECVEVTHEEVEKADEYCYNDPNICLMDRHAC